MAQGKRGRPRGSKAQKKAPAASGTVTTDHNNKDGQNVFQLRPTPEQEKTLFFQHRRKYQDALGRKKQVDAELRNVCKLAKGDGINVDAIKLSLVDADVLEAKIKSEVSMMQQVTTWMALPIGTQLSLLTEVGFNQPDRRPSDDKAFADGEVAGLSGQDCDPPYAGHLPQANQWRQGWNQGQEALRSRFTLKDESDEPWPAPADDVTEQRSEDAEAFGESGEENDSDRYGAA